MAQLQQLIQWCDQTLQSAQFKDYCPNGLQIEGKQEVQYLVSSVTASLQAVEAALDLKADALIVHHGYFWKGEPSPLTGLKGKRIKQLLQADISLIAYHLPLDAHPQLGNNAALAALLGIKITGALDPSESHPIGNVGTLAQPLSSEQFVKLLTDKLGQVPIHIDTHKSVIKKIGFCTGAAQDFLYKAATLTCDAYLSGEISERTFHEAHEYGLDYFAAGHHATERFGIQHLGKALAKQFDLQYDYIELNNPI
ncbi:Nif3-like dinuclear metal center hexameric protein [Acinetobacter qingfengensis]|uniref:Nif3-like dinuclear metal center hexameric protein n=1 Tax=Acinetobacter qingfengensis TaxID=1262585 RepID=A0A1E7R9H8_9GAMM|nr:Nif3-like dinuclear metal center hexameric protein [Acinetobacter qingfengensis]KAA8735482.1 Nif3-like dinuclear metal center hexameric protein [Acinetobacter qingfengensis]OEY95942.1 Nif3-like dinuclear metal center hexameric protein [Acinetobacter qingfengensis]